MTWLKPVIDIIELEERENLWKLQMDVTQTLKLAYSETSYSAVFGCHGCFHCNLPVFCLFLIEKRHQLQRWRSKVSRPELICTFYNRVKIFTFYMCFVFFEGQPWTFCSRFIGSERGDRIYINMSYRHGGKKVDIFIGKNA